LNLHRRENHKSHKTFLSLRARDADVWEAVAIEGCCLL
jgi:hypothetical protein